MRRSLVPLRALPSPAVQLFCMHHAGGATVAFREWPRQLRRDVAVPATLLPGRERRFNEPMHPHMDAAADEVAQAIAAEWPACGHVVLFGHSLGGLLAFEVCRRLEARDLCPARVVVSGVAPVSKEVSNRHEWTDEALEMLLADLGGTPAEVFQNRDLLALCVRILRADLRLVETYRAAGRPAILAPITAIGGADDRYVGRAGLHQWTDYTRGGCDVEMFPGGHFYLDEHRLDVIRWLEGHLAERGLLDAR